MADAPERVRRAAEGFVRSFAVALERAARSDPALDGFADTLHRIPTGRPARVPDRAGQHPALSHLAALDAEAGSDAFGIAGFNAARAMSWLPVAEGEGLDPVLAAGMIAAQAVGTFGSFDSRDIAAGLFLIAPGVNYPLHTHAAAEVYWCLGGSVTIRHGVGGQPFALGAGRYSVTPPNRVHTLVTAETPVLLAYLWTGDLTAPIWWWDEPEPGQWRRTEYRRSPELSWQAVRSEAVTPEIMAEAHG